MIKEDILIKNTTREQREQIVNDALGIVDGLCDGCSQGIISMYDVYKYDDIKVSFSVLTQNNQINFSRILELSSFQMFIKEFMTAKLEAESEKNDTYEKVNNICYVTCAPWMRMTSVQHPMNYKIKDSIPRVCWGKYFVKNNKFLIDYSIQVNHSFQDGYHIARFFHELQREIESFNGELNDSMY